MKRCFSLLNGDRLNCTEQAAILTFSGPRAVLSTAANGGGLRRDLSAVFNYSDCGPAGVCRPMEGDTLLEHQRAVARRLGLDPEHTTGLDTAVNLDNMVLVTRQWQELWVTAAVSAGADVNALCAGDPATLTEQAGKPCAVPAGTINIFLITGQALSPGAMVELVLTATEAKTAVLRDLMQGSSASPRLATGTGTDGLVIVCDDSGTSPCLLNAGKHFKFGELAAQAVSQAVAEALLRQTGLCPEFQRSLLRRLQRFGINAQSLQAHCSGSLPGGSAAFDRALAKLDRDSFAVSAVALYLHLIDQLHAGLLTPAQADDWAEHLLGELAAHFQFKATAPDTAQSLEQRLEGFLAGLLLAHLREQEQLYPTA